MEFQAESDNPVIQARGIGVEFSIYGPNQSIKHRIINTLLGGERESDE